MKPNSYSVETLIHVAKLNRQKGYNTGWWQGFFSASGVILLAIIIRQVTG